MEEIEITVCSICKNGGYSMKEKKETYDRKYHYTGRRDETNK